MGVPRAYCSRTCLPRSTSPARQMASSSSSREPNLNQILLRSAVDSFFHADPVGISQGSLQNLAGGPLWKRIQKFHELGNLEAGQAPPHEILDVLLIRFRARLQTHECFRGLAPFLVRD